MAQFLYKLEGVRGRSMEVYDRKCVISTKVSMGSILTGNVTDGEKTIFYADVVGVQFKKSGGMIGYLQLETGSVQMNNQNSNMFSENTFTFENGKNGVTNEAMENVYHQICDLIEQTKYGSISGAPAAMPAPAPAPAPMPAPAPAGGMRFCNQCGNQLAAGATFCNQCGGRVG
jgi:hypothetical protein